MRARVAVIGSGIAGLSSALGAAERGVGPVVVLSKSESVSGSSPLAQGGIAAAVGADDASELHAQDTLEVARGLADAEVVEDLTVGARPEIDRLMAWGARFDRRPDGQVALGREGGHGRRRVLHAQGDRTGREIMRVLHERVAADPAIEILEEFFAVDLLLSADRRRVAGLWGWCGGERVAVLAPAVVLSTGGIGQLFLHTTNPAEVTGDGIAMAARAGASLADMEFVQFHPTTLVRKRDAEDGGEGESRSSVALLTEALRGEGAHLVDDDGQRFMCAIHPDAELAPRDVVARTLFRRGAAGLDSRLALAPVVEQTGRAIKDSFPSAAHAALEAGLDPERDPLPVTPAAHYFMGGIAADSRGRSSLAGLWACGETSSTGVHGANRLASNSLLEGLVFGFNVGADIATTPARVDEVSDLVPADESVIEGPSFEHVDPEGRERLRRIMWNGAGIERDAEGLRHAIAELGSMENEPPTSDLELRNMIAVGRLVAAAALLRRESRGGHARRDYPGADPRQARRRVLTAGEWLQAAFHLDDELRSTPGSGVTDSRTGC